MIIKGFWTFKSSKKVLNKLRISVYSSKLIGASIVSADSGGRDSQERSQSSNGFLSNQSHEFLASGSLIGADVVWVFTENGSVQVRGNDGSEFGSFQQIGNLTQEFLTLSASDILQ